MNRKRAYRLGLCCILLPLLTRAQDIHFSRPEYLPGYLNAAFTGAFNADYRFSSVYRSQWNQVPVPYNTFGLQAEGRYAIKKIKYLGVGVSVLNDVAGDGQFTTQQLGISVAYHKNVADSTLQLSVGFQPYLRKQFFKLQNLYFYNQLSNNGIDQTLPSNELFSTTQLTRFNFNAGFAATKLLSNGQLTIGYTRNNNRLVDASFKSAADVKTDVLHAFQGIFEWQLNEAFGIMPVVYFQKQGKYKETVVGSELNYRLADNEKDLKVGLGLYWRNQDAIIPSLSYNTSRLKAAISYDLNYSDFKAATNKQGAVELGVLYLLKIPKAFVAKSRVCPTYM